MENHKINQLVNTLSDEYKNLLEATKAQIIWYDYKDVLSWALFYGMKPRKPRVSLKRMRKLAGWDHGFLDTVLMAKF